MHEDSCVHLDLDLDLSGRELPVWTGFALHLYGAHANLQCFLGICHTVNCAGHVRIYHVSTCAGGQGLYLAPLWYDIVYQHPRVGTVVHEKGTADPLHMQLRCTCPALQLP